MSRIKKGIDKQNKNNTKKKKKKSIKQTNKNLKIKKTNNLSKNWGTELSRIIKKRTRNG